MGCISKGIAYCGKRQFKDAMKVFDLAFMFVDADMNKTRLLLLIKVHNSCLIYSLLTRQLPGHRPFQCRST
jgi:hypothetical protein